MDWSASGIRQRWWAELLDSSGNLLSTIDGATGFQVDAKAGADVQLSGTLDLQLQGPLAWRSHQCRIWTETTGPDGQTASHPLITGLMEAGNSRRTATGVSVSVQLLDPTTRLDSAIGETLSAAAGTVITTRIRQVLADLAITDPAITESSRTLSTPMVWTPTATWRRVLNDLAGAANYRAAWADGWGRLQIHPYVLPSARPVALELVHGPAATFAADISEETNAAKIPNHLVVMSTSDGESAPMSAQRWDLDPESDWSVPARGGRVISRVEENVDAADQQTLEAHADRLWASSRSLSRKLRIAMRWQPVQLADRVRLVSGPTSWADRLSASATVQGIAVKGEAGQPLGPAELDLEVIDG